jgi:uncharacterized protein (DUF1015 family)
MSVEHFNVCGYVVSTHASIRHINKLFRSIDESHKWPVSGRFNATERAIRRMRKLRREYGPGYTVEEYAYALRDEIARIVNAEV